MPTVPPAYQSYTTRIPIVYQSYTNRIPIVYRIPIVHQSYTNRIPLYTTVYHRIPSYTVVYRYIRRYLRLHTNIVQPQAYTTFVSHTSIFNRVFFFQILLPFTFKCIPVWKIWIRIWKYYPRISEETFYQKSLWREISENNFANKSLLEESLKTKILKTYPYQTKKSSRKNLPKKLGREMFYHFFWGDMSTKESRKISSLPKAFWKEITTPNISR